jgi:enoyl-CoA hydratase/carnithine racemase
MTLMTELAKVVCAELPCDNGRFIGHVSLHKPTALNAIDSEMIALLNEQLQRWQHNPAICMVLLDSQSDKAFCAGGDVVAMYHAMQAHDKNSDEVPAALAHFFTHEYQLDYLIHTYPKPILCWGHGIVMGGGLGLMSGASHRIVTQTSRIAMPEITIGLYPDVGGSYFLNKMPAGCGLFLGLTAASLNAADALYCNLADYYLPHETKDAFLTVLQKADWHMAADQNHVLLTQLCQHQANHVSEDTSPALLPAMQSKLEALAQCDDLRSAVKQILAWPSDGNSWLSKAQATLTAGSPISAHLVFEQLKRAATMSLADCFKMELIMSCRCGMLGEFQEGVRALLVDKDREPSWLYATLEDVPQTCIESFFTSPWGEGKHLLTNLGQD